MASFRCTECGNTFPNINTPCPTEGCPGGRDTYERVVDRPARAGLGGRAARAGEAAPDHRLVRLSSVNATEHSRVLTGIAEFDRAVGGGLVKGTFILLAGEPGSGKTTLASQVTDALVRQGHEAIYITGEESAAQIRLRAERLGLDLDDLRVLAETDASIVAATIAAERPLLAVIDSIQTLVVPTSDGIAGGPAQIREVANLLLQTAKTTGTALILIGHVTKEGAAAGPETLQHLVDAVMLIEGDRFGFFRILRATKNRYGAIDEMGLFEMTDKGMVGVDSPTQLKAEGGEAFGRVICPVFEGTRVILMEVQALVAKAAYSSPRRVAEGISEKRVAMLLAVLERYADLDLSGHDVYIRTSAGMAINDPAIDAAVCAAIASSYWSMAIEHTTAVFGEVALGGGIRPVRALPSRIKEASRLGLNRLAGPGPAPGRDQLAGVEYATSSDIASLLKSVDVLRPINAKAVEGRAAPDKSFMAGLKAASGRRGGGDAD